MLTKLLRAPFDFGVFAEVASQRALRSIGALAILILLSAGVATTIISLTMHKAYRELAPLVDTLPTVVIKEGKASANVPQPWVREQTEGLKTIALIIDTTGATTGFTPRQIGLLLTVDKIFVKSESGDVKSFELSTLGDQTVGPTELHALVRHWLGLMPWLVGVTALVWFIFAKTSTVMVLVLIALLASQGRRRPLTFGGLFAVAVHALAPAVFVDCALMVMPFSIPMFWVLYAALAMVYVAVGVQKVPEVEAKV